MMSSANLCYTLSFRGPINEARLVVAVREVVNRHEVLRTALRAGDDGLPRQHVLSVEEGLGDVPIIDVSKSSRSHDEVAQLAKEESERPMDIEKGVVRCKLLRVSDDQCVLIFNVHHVAFDGASLGILVRDLESFYAGNAPEPLPVQYRDFALWSAKSLDSFEVQRQTEYWRQKLQNAPGCVDYPFDYCIKDDVQDGASVELQFPQHTSDAVLAWCTASDFHPYSVFLAAFTTVLASWTGQHDILVGTPSCSITPLRSKFDTIPSLRGTQKLIGFFVNTMVARAQIDLQISFTQFVKELEQDRLKNLDNMTMPFLQLAQVLDLPKNEFRTPIIQTMMSFAEDDEGGEFADLMLDVDCFTADKVGFDLTLSFLKSSIPGSTKSSVRMSRCWSLSKIVPTR